nr:MAG TPA: hypothetical protein [Caudoviricetes sp.]
MNTEEMEMIAEYGVEAFTFGKVVETCLDNANGDEWLFVLFWQGCFPELEFDEEKGRDDGYHAWQNGLHAEFLEDFVGNYDRLDYDVSNPWFWWQLRACGHKYGWH